MCTEWICNMFVCIIHILLIKIFPIYFIYLFLYLWQRYHVWTYHEIDQVNKINKYQAVCRVWYRCLETKLDYTWLYNTLALPVVLYGNETWTSTKIKNHRLWINDNCTPRMMCQYKSEEHCWTPTESLVKWNRSNDLNCQKDTTTTHNSISAHVFFTINIYLFLVFIFHLLY